MRSPRFSITRCPSGKVVHHTYKRAVKQADRMRRFHPDTVSRGGDFRAYRCDHCHGWHTGRRWMIHTTADLREDAR